MFPYSGEYLILPPMILHYKMMHMADVDPPTKTNVVPAYTAIATNAHAGSRTRVTSMGGLYNAATLHAPCWNFNSLSMNAQAI